MSQPPADSAGIKVSHSYTAQGHEEPAIMVPEFEITALSEKASRLRKSLPSGAGSAWACLGMGVGIGGTPLALYAYNQHIKYEIALTLWAVTAVLAIVAVVLFVVRRGAKKTHADAVSDYCEELAMLVRRYGGEAATELFHRMDMIAKAGRHDAG
jgi:hypothetical protein